MSKKKIHIDDLFRNGLRSLRLLVSDKDFEAIDKKSNQLSEGPEPQAGQFFKDFELDVTESDWLATKSKLEAGKSGLSDRSVFNEKLQDLSIEPEREDWPMTLKKYREAKRRRALAYWWLSAGVLLLLAGLIYLFTPSDSVISPENLPVSESSVPVDTQNRISKQSEIPNEVSSDHSSRGESTSENSVKSDHRTSGTVPQAVSPRNNQYPSFKESAWAEVVDARIKNVKKVSEAGSIEKAMLFETKSSDDKGAVKEQAETLSGNSGERIPETEKESGNDEKKAETVTENIEEPQVINPQVPVKDSNLTKDKDAPKPRLFAPKAYLAMVNRVDYTQSFLPSDNLSEYNSVRKGADKPSIQYSAGFEYGRTMKKGFSWNVGLQYTSINRVSSYNYSYKIHDSLPVYDPNGHIIGYWLTRTRDTFMNSTESVRLSRLQLPIGLSFQKAINEKLGLDFGFGATFTLNTQSSGTRMLHPQNLQLYPYQALMKNERSLNVMPDFSAGFNYRFNPRWMISTRINTSFYAFSRFKADYGAKEYLYSGGLNIKLMYLLKH